jgi:hypothetical protein
MSSISQRFTKASGVFLIFATAALTGCAVTTGGGMAAQSPGAANYLVCSGGHASRFPEREEIGRTCRASTSLHAIY